MRRITKHAVPAALALAAALPLTAAAPRRAPAVVRQVDHVVIVAPDPRPLFALLADTLRLPVAWPVARFGEFVSGGVSVGNLNVEVYAGRAAGGARFAHVVFEPEPLAGALAELDARRIAHEAPEPYGSRDAGAAGPAWATVELPGLSSPGAYAVLCEYYRPDIAALRRALTDSLRRRDGGPLGVLGAARIVVGTGGDAAYAAAWSALLAPARPGADGAWALGGGPHVTLDARAPKGLRRLVLRVRSLDAARAALRAAALLGGGPGGGPGGGARELRLAPARVGGLDIRLVQDDAAR